MALVTKNDVTQIFAIQAPSVDLPPTFTNYPRGWDTARSNNGKPTIKQFNYIQQRTDQSVLWIHQNGAALPYDATMEYAEGAVVVKGGELQQLKYGQWKPTRDTDVIKTVDSIAEMLAIQTPTNGTVVYAKGYRAPTLFVEANPFKGGGAFIFDSSRSSVNDGGVILNGWVRQIKDRIAPCMFGAYADDSANDVQYIQASINFAIENKKILDFEGRYYCVKKETYTAEVLQHFLSINGEVEIIGNNASVRIDQSTAPAASKIMTLFRPFRKPEDATNYSKSIGRIHIHGFDFDGGFDYDTETDLTTVQDVKKCFLFYCFEVIYDELKINSNRIKRFAQQNVIAVGFSPSFKTYGIAKKTTISGNYFFDNGLDADMSTLYLVSNDITVDGANKFEQPVGREKHCLCAMELHGSNAVVTGNYFKNMVSWVNLASNEIEAIVGKYIVDKNTGEAIENVARIWSGEVPEEAELSDLIVTNNSVDFIDSPQFDVSNRNRSVLGTGGFNKSFKSLIVGGNTARVKTLTDTKPIYFVDIAVNLDWVSDIGNISISNNSGFDMTGFAALGRYTGQSIDNCIMRNISVSGNSLFNTADASIKAITINQIDDASVFTQNLNVFGNTVSSTFNKLAWFVKGEGNINNVDIGLNNYNSKPVSTDAFIFTKKPSRISTTQSRNSSEYADITSNKTPYVESVKTEYLQSRIPLNLLEISGTTGYLTVGVFYSGVRVKAARVKMSIGVSTINSGDTLTAQMIRASEIFTNPVSVLDKPEPTLAFTLTPKGFWQFSENKVVSLQFNTNVDTYLNTLKASGGNAFIEFEIEKLM